MTEREIFLAVLDLPDPADRSRYLDKVCGDPAQRARVESLLLSHDTAGSFLGNPAVQPQEPNGATQELGVDQKANSDADDDLHFLTPSKRPDSLGRLAHYEMLQVLGRGGFGIVFRAFDDILQRVVAIKVMAPQIATLSPARKRFLREARSSAAVRHENVVQVYEVGEQPLPYLAMEFIPAETLQQRLDRIGPVEVSEVLRIGRQIAEGLAAAHASDLIHRDIKPGNILLEGGSQKVKITDFGLARAADDASISQSGVVAGTPMFMAPEQALGHTIDQRADLFSLGSVLYQMASGRPPFRAPSVLAVLKRVAEEPPRPIQEIIPETPDWLCGIITKLHAKDPNDRFQSAREVADLLADCEAKLKAKQEVKNVLPAAARPAGRKWVAAATALLLLTSVSIAVWLLWPGFTGTLNVDVENDPARIGQSVLVRITKAPAEVRDASDRNWSESSWGGRAFDLKPGRYVVQVGYRDKKLNDATFSEEITISARLVTTVTVPTEFFATAKKPPEQTGVKDDAVLRDAVLVMNFEKDTFYEKDGKTYVRDLSGNGNDGLCEKVAFTPDGKAGGGLLCQGGRLQLAKSLINRQPNYTTTAWCRFEKPRPAVLTLFLTAMPENVKGPCFGMFIPPEMSFVVNAWNAALPDVWNGASTESESVPAKDWFFVAVSLTDGGTGKGKLRIVIDDQVHLRQSQMVASRNYDPHVDMFGLAVCDVVIDELTVFQRALSDEEIAAIRARGLKGIPLGVGTLSTLPKTVNEAWVKQVAAMPAEQQVDAVAAKLKDLNPGFDGTVKHKIEDGVVTELRIVTDKVTNIAPIQVFNSLRVLDLSGTITSDLRKTGQLADLSTLKAMNLVGLTHLILNRTKVSDADLTHFKDCVELTFLSLQGTPVSDAGMAFFDGRKSLTYLDLSATKVSDEGLLRFKGCKELTLLGLSSTKVSNAGLANFKDSMNLTILGLYDTQVGDEGLVHFKGCENLTALCLSGTQVSDVGLAYFKHCKSLTILHLQGTRVSDTGLDYFDDCKGLRSVNLQNTKVTAAKIAELKKALPDCKVEWDGVDPAPEKRGPPPADAPLEAGFKADHQNRFNFAVRASG